ncbi:hypothetical protein [Actinoallomurus iriomotensis]|uniref:hypothetical protein n=1 Tax=Actinoallomurus iriomotensis TaxID=478107 RepID=UPI0032DA3AF4
MVEVGRRKMSGGQEDMTTDIGAASRSRCCPRRDRLLIRTAGTCRTSPCRRPPSRPGRGPLLDPIGTPEHQHQLPPFRVRTLEQAESTHHRSRRGALQHQRSETSQLQPPCRCPEIRH